MFQVHTATSTLWRPNYTLSPNNNSRISLLFEVLEVGDGVFEVLSTSGDTHLGGDDFDKVELPLD